MFSVCRHFDFHTKNKTSSLPFALVSYVSTGFFLILIKIVKLHSFVVSIYFFPVHVLALFGAAEILGFALRCCSVLSVYIFVTLRKYFPPIFPCMSSLFKKQLLSFNNHILIDIAQRNGRRSLKQTNDGRTCRVFIKYCVFP